MATWRDFIQLFQLFSQIDRQRREDARQAVAAAWQMLSQAPSREIAEQAEGQLREVLAVLPSDDPWRIAYEKILPSAGPILRSLAERREAREKLELETAELRKKAMEQDIQAGEVRLQAEQMRLQEEQARRELGAAMADRDVLRAMVRFDPRKPETLDEVQSALERVLGPDRTAALKPYILGEALGVWTKVVNGQTALLQQARDAVAIERERLQIELLRNQLKTQEELLGQAGQSAFNLELGRILNEDVRHAFTRLTQLAQNDLHRVAASDNPRVAYNTAGERFANNMEAILFGTREEDRGKPVRPLLKQAVASAIWQAWLEAKQSPLLEQKAAAMIRGETRGISIASEMESFIKETRENARLRSAVWALLGNPTDEETIRLFRNVVQREYSPESIMRRGPVPSNVFMHVRDGVKGILTNQNLELKQETFAPLRAYRSVLERLGETADRIIAGPGAGALVYYKDLLGFWAAIEAAALEMVKLGAPARPPEGASRQAPQPTVSFQPISPYRPD